MSTPEEIADDLYDDLATPLARSNAIPLILSSFTRVEALRAQMVDTSAQDAEDYAKDRADQLTDLQTKLADAERERDEAQITLAVHMNRSLTRRDLTIQRDHYAASADGLRRERDAFKSDLSASQARERKLREALQIIQGDEVYGEFPSSMEFETDARSTWPARLNYLRDIARFALAETEKGKVGE